MAMGPGRKEHVPKLFFPFCKLVFFFFCGGDVARTEGGYKGKEWGDDVIWMHDVKYRKN